MGATKSQLMEESWLDNFKEEFWSRTGITCEDAGLTDAEALKWSNYSDVEDAVTAYIEKYDLEDRKNCWRTPLERGV